jgi:hypothetical protein
MKRWHVGLIAAALCLPLPSSLQAQTAGSTGAHPAHAPITAPPGGPLPRARPEDVGISSERLASISKVINALVEQAIVD